MESKIGGLDINSDLGKIILYQSEDGQTALDEKFQDVFIWIKSCSDVPF